MAEKLTITNRQLLDLRRGLNSLDAVKAGKDGEVIPLEFDAKTRYRLMKNASIVERESLAYDKTDRTIANEAGVYDGMEKTDGNGRKIDDYRRKMEDVLDQPIELDGILLVKLSDLLTRSDPKNGEKPKPNPVPQSVLAKLAVIIEEEDEP